MSRGNDSNQGENELFSLEDIIAEVKAEEKGYINQEKKGGEPSAEKPDREADGNQDTDGIPVFGTPGFEPHREDRPEKHRSKPEPAPGPKIIIREEKLTGGQKEPELFKAVPSSGGEEIFQKINERRTARAEPEIKEPSGEGNDDSGETSGDSKVVGNAPGRRVILFRKRKTPEKVREEEEEPQEEEEIPAYPVNDDEDYYIEEEEYEEEEEEKEDIPYDFLNIPFDDSGKAVNRLGKKLESMSFRLVLIFVLMAAAGVFTFGKNLGLPALPEEWGIKPEFFEDIVPTACGFVSLLLCWEVLTAGIWRFFKLRPTLDSLTVFSSFCAIVHGFLSVFGLAQGESICFVTCLCCFSALAGKRRRAANLRRVYKCMEMSADPAAIKIIGGKKSRAAIKTHINALPDTEDVACTDMTEKISLIFAPLAIVASIILAFVASFGTGGMGIFPTALAIISSVIAPCAMTMSSVRPWGKVSKKIFASGAAIINYHCAAKLASVKRAGIDDSDIFPLGSVRIGGMKITSNHISMEQAVADAAAIMKDVGGGVGKAFGDFAREQYLAPRKALDVRYYQGGGISARVRDDYVLMGNADFMRGMGINLREESEKKDAVFLAINSYEAAIFTLKYSVQAQPYTAFGIFARRGITADLAVKDFTIKESMIEKKFSIKSSLLSLPPLEVKKAYWSGEPASDEPPCAILMRESFLSLAETLSAAKNIVKSVRINIFCALACSMIGMVTMYFLAAMGKIYLASPANIALYLVIWYMPVWFTGAFMTNS